MTTANVQLGVNGINQIVLTYVVYPLFRFQYTLSCVRL